MIERRDRKHLHACMVAMLSLLMVASQAGAVDLFRELDPVPPRLTAPAVRTLLGLPYTDTDPEPAGVRLVLYKVGTLADPDPVFPRIVLARTASTVVINTLLSGACCGGQSTCMDVDPQAACEAQGYLWAGPGTACSDVPFPCTALEGACCSLGLCEDGHVPGTCLGAFAGSGTRCADVPPPCSPSGACCVGNGTCIEVLQPVCEMSGGMIFQPGVSCSTDPCGGACCVDGGSCAQVNRALCSTLAGVYLGSLGCASLPPATCADYVGACCTGTTCTESVTEDSCTRLLGGRWLGPRSTCPPPPC